jgi:hypothetical protein
MKTFSNLYHRIHDFRRLLEAWRGKRHTPTAATFEQSLDDEMIAILNCLIRELVYTR